MSGLIALERGKFAAQEAKLRALLLKKLDARTPAVERRMREAAAAVAVDLALLCFPARYGVPLALAAIAQDIRSVFTDAGGAYEIIERISGRGAAGAFYAAYQRGDMARARVVLQKHGGPLKACRIGPLDPALHQRYRAGKRRRVQISAPQVIVPREELKAYIKDVQRRAGQAAAGWAACAAELGGGAAIPPWKNIGVHGSAGGSVTAEQHRWSFRFLLRNHVPHSPRMLSSGQVKRVLAGHAATFRGVGL